MFGVEDGGNVHLYTVAADGSAEPELLVGGERAIAGLRPRRRRARLHREHAHASARALRRRRRKQADERRRRVHRRLRARRAGAVHGGLADGTEVDAWLVRPPGFEEGKSYPTLLTIHGGPFSQYGTGFFDEVQVYCGRRLRGALLEPARRLGLLRGVGTRDPRPARRRRHRLGPRRLRGSDGRRRHGAREVPVPRRRPARRARRLVRRLHDVVDHRPHEALQGGALGARRQQPHRACSARATSAGSSSASSAAQMWENMDEYLGCRRRRTREDIETPVLVLHSENDLRCNIEQGEQLFNLLRLIGKDVEMLRFPAESHELSRSGSPDAPRAAVRGDPRVVRALPLARRLVRHRPAGRCRRSAARPGPGRRRRRRVTRTGRGRARRS